MRKVLGVDAGNSKTLALVAGENGRILGLGRAGPGNHQTVGLEQALGEIEKACKEALFQGAVSEPVEVGVFGLAGADLPEDFSLLGQALEGLKLAREVHVENDTMVALRAGTNQPWGVVVVCGAGFNAAGIAPDGRICRLPGLGWISGDWGGGWELAREAVRQVARAWDGRGEPTLLTDLFLSALGVKSVEEMISALYHHDVEERELLNLVPCIFEAAYQGDKVAKKILLRLGEEVGITAAAVIRKLGLEKTEVEVVLAGGVFEGNGPWLLDTVSRIVRQYAPRAKIVRPRFAPVVGALLLALERMLGHVPPEVMEELEQSLPQELRSGRGKKADSQY